MSLAHKRRDRRSAQKTLVSWLASGSGNKRNEALTTTIGKTKPLLKSYGAATIQTIGASIVKSTLNTLPQTENSKGQGTLAGTL